MSFYLAWSFTELLISLGAFTILLHSVRKQIPKKWMFLIPYVILAFAAVNVGDRQQELNRGSFNNNNIQHIEKVEVDVLDSEKVNKQFNEKVGPNNE